MLNMACGRLSASTQETAVWSEEFFSPDDFWESRLLRLSLILVNWKKSFGSGFYEITVPGYQQIQADCGRVWEACFSYFTTNQKRFPHSVVRRLSENLKTFGPFKKKGKLSLAFVHIIVLAWHLPSLGPRLFFILLKRNTGLPQLSVVRNKKSSVVEPIVSRSVETWVFALSSFHRHTHTHVCIYMYMYSL